MLAVQNTSFYFTIQNNHSQSKNRARSIFLYAKYTEIIYKKYKKYKRNLKRG